LEDGVNLFKIFPPVTSILSILHKKTGKIGNTILFFFVINHFFANPINLNYCVPFLFVKGYLIKDKTKNKIR